MSFRYSLSVAEIKILLVTEHELLENEQFRPFVSSETDPDVCAVFQPADQLPLIPDQVLYTDR